MGEHQEIRDYGNEFEKRREEHPETIRLQPPTRETIEAFKSSFEDIGKGVTNEVVYGSAIKLKLADFDGIEPLKVLLVKKSISGVPCVLSDHVYVSGDSRLGSALLGCKSGSEPREFINNDNKVARISVESVEFPPEDAVMKVLKCL